MNDLDLLNTLIAEDTPPKGAEPQEQPIPRWLACVDEPRPKRKKKFRGSKAKAIDELKMLCGLPPHDGGSNICCGDGYFAMSLVRKYGMEIEDLKRAVGFDEIQARWDRARAEFS